MESLSQTCQFDILDVRFEKLLIYISLRLGPLATNVIINTSIPPYLIFFVCICLFVQVMMYFLCGKYNNNIRTYFMINNYGTAYWALFYTLTVLPRTTLTK